MPYNEHFDLYLSCFFYSEPWNGFKMEFAAMMHALDFAQHVVRDDVDKSKKLLFALCHR